MLTVFKNVAALPALPRAEIVLETSTWASFVQGGVTRQYYLEIPLALFKDCSTIVMKVLYTGAAFAQTHQMGPVIYDKIGTKKVQVCSRQALTASAGSKVNALFAFTGSTSFFSPSAYSTDSLTQDIQNNVSGYYTTTETSTAASVVTTVVQNMPQLSANATCVFAYSQSTGLGSEPMSATMLIYGNQA